MMQILKNLNQPTCKAPVFGHILKDTKELSNHVDPNEHTAPDAKNGSPDEQL